MIGLMVSLGVLEALEETTGAEPGGSPIFALKWPNDILADGRKVCGILCEAGTDAGGEGFIVAGVGVNVSQTARDFPPELRRTATSLLIAAGKVYSRETLLDLILRRTEVYYHRLLAQGAGWIAGEWEARAGIAGKAVTVTVGRRRLRGVCAGLQLDGAMRLKLTSGEFRAVYSGEVE